MHLFAIPQAEACALLQLELYHLDGGGAAAADRSRDRKRTLYTLVYNERGRLGNTYSGKREGLTVLTPYDGIYFQFERRQGRQDVVVRNPQQIIDAVAAEYQADTLDVRSFRKVEPVQIARYDIGSPRT